MILRKTTISSLLAAELTMTLYICNKTAKKISTDNKSTSTYQQDNQALKFDTTKWNYDSTNDVYWRIGVPYCSTPGTAQNETMGIYVPGKYMTGIKNSEGTYICKINTSGELNGYTSETAPIILPINTPGYMNQAAPTSYNYNSIASYLKAGYVYILPGIRGRDNIMRTTNTDQSYSGGAPWGITDIKAAVRYYRFNESLLPRDTDRFFTYVMSGGGAQSALMGATGDSKDYYPYLECIGAAMTDESGNSISDAIEGSMAWCPVTSLDYADEAYEWNMGQYFSTNTRDSSKFTSALSKDMANEFASYLNKLGLKWEDGIALTLSQSNSGIYNSGTYYDYILSQIETSLNNFLSDTTFPYTPKAATIQIRNTGPSGGGIGNLAGRRGEGRAPGQDIAQNQDDAPGANNNTISDTKIYHTAQDYINSLNTDENWVTYDVRTNTAKITSIESFVKHCKNATKPVGAFDNVGFGRVENNLFGNGLSPISHFDSVESNLLSQNASTYSKYNNWDSSYVTAFADALKSKDSIGTDMVTRVNMYSPMYYLTNKNSTVAKYWRIRTGINQTDTTLTVETNLKLALQNYDGVKNVDFAAVWGQPHTMAERTGNSVDNFISWVNNCLANENWHEYFVAFTLSINTKRAIWIYL